MRIVVTPEDMQNSINRIRDSKAKFEECIQDMRTIVDNVTSAGVFEGQAATAYRNNFESYQSQFTQFGALIESFANNLDSAMKKMEETDQSIAGSFG